MEDLVKWLVVAIVVIALIWGVIALAIVVVTFAFYLAYFTLAISLTAILAGATNGFFVLTIADWISSRKFRNPASLASIASHEITPEGIRFRLLERKLYDSSDFHLMNVIAALTSAFVAAWALYLKEIRTAGTGIALTVSSGIALSVAHYVAWLVPVAFIVLFLKGGGMKGVRTGRIRARIEACGTMAKASVASAAALDSIENEIATLASNLSIKWPDQYRRALERYVDCNGSVLFVDARPANHLLTLLTSLAKMDRDCLSIAKGQWDRFWSRYNALAKHLRIAPRPSLARELDVFAANIPKLTSLLPVRRWDLFGAALSNAESELHALESNLNDANQSGSNEETYSGQRAASMTEDSEGPYKVLGVSREMPFDEIKSVYRNLAKVYHDRASSGKSVKVLERRMQEINDAFAEIERINTGQTTTRGVTT